ncbi:cell division/cell wall cluster transcriptional repressor MraZ [Actinobacillus delphinicola]|uniref:Transcriptional regulator MraZ n=1 Tax=Actinobacillus delphinicola TaxID=51161 RepID=A0A448TUK4_9PAST|nr:division/cell wall cluster transcriptional repressor MraZ [Actinobacillus delphinicola]MDG6897733.1 cell division/cell wall cluster transcriptional repressor MraZ [Actinobacillus delphinicola]VEJ09615.1 cell division protein MraZ [Actinobacillus delphinicola]
MFRGASAINLDSKGRIAIPKRYRAEIVDKSQGLCICTVDIRQPCLLLYPLHEWKVIEEKLLTLSNIDPIQRSLQRIILGYATECELDSAGRVLLTGPLRQHAKLEKNIMLIGQLNKFEIWSEALWNTQIQEDIALVANTDLTNSDALSNFSL